MADFVVQRARPASRVEGSRARARLGSQRQVLRILLSEKPVRVPRYRECMEMGHYSDIAEMIASLNRSDRAVEGRRNLVVY